MPITVVPMERAIEFQSSCPKLSPSISVGLAMTRAKDSKETPLGIRTSSEGCATELGSRAIETTHQTGKIEKSEKLIKIACASASGSHFGSRFSRADGWPALGTRAVSSVTPSGETTERGSTLAI